MPTTAERLRPLLRMRCPGCWRRVESIHATTVCDLWVYTARPCECVLTPEQHAALQRQIDAWMELVYSDTGLPPRLSWWKRGAHWLRKKVRR